jgi:hypothetical protein
MRLQVLQGFEVAILGMGEYREVAFTEITLDNDDETPEMPRPKSREECKNVPRPCPYVTCRYNLYLDVRGDGVLRINFPDREPEEMLASCALDLSEDGPRTLDAVAGLMGMSKERARQIEASAMQKLQKALGAKEYHDLNEE